MFLWKHFLEKKRLSFTLSLFVSLSHPKGTLIACRARIPSQSPRPAITLPCITDAPSPSTIRRAAIILIISNEAYANFITRKTAYSGYITVWLIRIIRRKHARQSAAIESGNSASSEIADFESERMGRTDRSYQIGAIARIAACPHIGRLDLSHGLEGRIRIV